MRKVLLTLITSVLLMVFSSADFAINTSVDTFGPTKANDRLWRIAIETRPSSEVSPQQMMVALWKNNPGVFKKNNMNGLFSGIMLNIPEMDEILDTSALDATKIVANHNKLWKEGRVVIPDPEQAIVSSAKPQLVAATTSIPQSTSPHLKLIQLQAHLDLLSGQMKEFMFFTHNRMAMMDDDQVVVRKQLLAMAQSLQSLSEQIDQQKATLATLSTSNRAEHFAWQQQLQSYVMLGGVIIAMLMVMLLITWIKMIKQTAEPDYLPNIEEPEHESVDQELEDEYDFINSAEGIPAKLDLARAYIDMDDMKGAEQILHEVIKCGDSAYRQEAQHLLSHIELPETAS